MPTPNTPLIWARCSDLAHLAQVTAIEDLLRNDGDPVRFICTLPDPTGTVALSAPHGQRDVRNFLFAHRPMAMLWIGGILDQASLAPCYAIELPVIVLEASEPMTSRILGSWMPHRARATLTKLHAVFAHDGAARRAFVSGGAHDTVVHVTGSMEDANTVLPYREQDRLELADTLGTRPVWLATHVRPEVVKQLCEAHRQAAKRAHRLMMILTPAETLDGPGIAAQCRALGLNTGLRSEGAEPEEATQIYLADDDDGMGLWYRLSPITFLGGTFGHGAADDPFHAAALGSVVIHGPLYGRFRQRFVRLTTAGATVRLKQWEDLGEAVAQMLSVDVAAEKANAGWDVTSQGAGTTALVASMLQNILDSEGK